MKMYRVRKSSVWSTRHRNTIKEYEVVRTTKSSVYFIDNKWQAENNLSSCERKENSYAKWFENLDKAKEYASHMLKSRKINLEEELKEINEELDKL